MSKINYAETFRPLTDLFTQIQLNTILLAYLPQKLESYLTGIITVDMFITSVIACGISTLLPALFQFINMTGLPWVNKKNVTIQIEYYSEGRFGFPYQSIFYEALSWLISQQTKKLKDGSFVIQSANLIYNKDDDDCAPPNFNVLPEKNQQITIEYKEKKYLVTYQIPIHSEKEKNNDNKDQINKQQLKPSIYLTTAENPNETSVDTTTEFLSEIVRSYLETQKKMKVRSRYERSETYWHYVQILSSARGLDSIALDESQEILLKKELETFVKDKSFYERIGMPYKRGILLYGKPGTGKTSLINAISSQLSRDIYYLNLKNIKNDNELSAAFSEVPENQIIVLEDVDTQSRVLHKRTKKSNVKTSNKSDDKSKDDKDDKEDKFSDFSLSTFLGCLDGHTLADGNIIIMTTNHVEHLDPACIRPGRMDVRLNLGYCTHYQIKKMYKSVAENPEVEFPQDILKKIPEKFLPPCEVMMTMILYRSEIELIPQKIYELVAKYKDINSEEAYADLTEKKETESEEVKDKNKDKKEDVNFKGEKEEIKDENNDKKEDVKGEKEEIKDENNDKKEDIKGEKEEIKDKNNDNKEDIKGEKEEIRDENNDKKEDVKGEKEEIKDKNNDKKENVKDEEEKIKDENNDKKENIKGEKEKIKDENKDKKEDVNDEIKKKEVVNEIQEEDVKDENKEDNKEDKKEEEIINEANINVLNEVINAEEDSDSITDVELEIENDKIKYFKTLETLQSHHKLHKKLLYKAL